MYMSVKQYLKRMFMFKPGSRTRHMYVFMIKTQELSQFMTKTQEMSVNPVPEEDVHVQAQIQDQTHVGVHDQGPGAVSEPVPEE